MQSKREKISDEKMRKFEAICAVVLVIFAITSYVFSTYIFKKKTTSDIKIYIQNQLINNTDNTMIDINKDSIFIIYQGKDNTIKTNLINDLEKDLLNYQDYDYNVIEIKGKKIHCIEANCPDKICMHHGYLRNDIDNDMIICAPHRMTICYE